MTETVNRPRPGEEGAPAGRRSPYEKPAIVWVESVDLGSATALACAKTDFAADCQAVNSIRS